MGHGKEVPTVSRVARRAGVTAVVAFVILAALAAPGKAYIYWTNNGPSISDNGTTLGRANNDGRGLKPALIKNASGPNGVIAHGKYIYWGQGTHTLARSSINGTGTNLNFITPGEPVDFLAISGPYIYWTSSDDWIGRANLNGSGVITQCINAGATPGGIVISGGEMYIGEFQQVERVSATCGAAPSIFISLAQGQATAFAMTLAGGYLYWTELIPGTQPASTIARAPLSNPSQADENFVPSLYLPSGVAVAGGYLYWVDHGGGPGGNGAIGREQLATQIRNYSFISDSLGPLTIFVDASIDPTATSVTCSPTRVAKNSPTVCTAVVHDASSSELPTGTVLFHGSAGVFFPGGNSCTLTKRPTGGAGCTVGAESAATGKHTVTGAYKGNPTHHASTGSTTFCAGSKTVCKKA